MLLQGYLYLSDIGAPPIVAFTSFSQTRCSH